MAVDSSVVDASDYRKHDPSGGYEGFSVLADGSIAAFIEKQSGDSTLGDEPGMFYASFRNMYNNCVRGVYSSFKHLSPKVFVFTKFCPEMELQVHPPFSIPSWDSTHWNLMQETLQMYLLFPDPVISLPSLREMVSHL